MPTTWNDVVAAVKAKMPKGTSLKDVLKAASPEWKRIKSGKHPTKGMASLTMPGKEDFTTKKTSKVFHRKGHYETESAEGESRRPYHGKRKSRKQRKGSQSRSSSVSKLPMSESVLVVDESPMAGGQALEKAAEPDQAAPDVEPPTPESGDQAAELTPKMEERIDRAGETTGTGDVNSEANLIAQPGMPSQQEGGRRRRGRKAGRRHSKSKTSKNKKRGSRRHRTAKRHHGKRRH